MLNRKGIVLQDKYIIMKKVLMVLLDKYFPKKYRVMIYDDFAKDLEARDCVICRTRMYTAKYTNHRFFPVWYVLDAITIKNESASRLVTFMQSCKEFCLYQEKREMDNSKTLEDVRPSNASDAAYLEWLKVMLVDCKATAPFKRKRWYKLIK